MLHSQARACSTAMINDKRCTNNNVIILIEADWYKVILNETWTLEASIVNATQ